MRLKPLISLGLVLTVVWGGYHFVHSFLAKKASRSVASFTQENGDITQLPTFNYKLSSIERSKMVRAFRELNLGDNSTRKSSICSNRAHFWAYDLYRRWNIQSGKIFVFYTNRLLSKKDEEWWYHVAPYVVSDGKEFVLDAGFRGDFKRIPTLKEWIQYFAYDIKPLSNESSEYASGDYSRCKEIDPNTDRDLLSLMELTEMLPNSKGRCYYYKAPMYYLTPYSLYEHHIEKNVSYTSFDIDDILAACKRSVPRLKFNFCYDYLGIDKSKYKEKQREEKRRKKDR